VLISIHTMTLCTEYFLAIALLFLVMGLFRFWLLISTMFERDAFFLSFRSRFPDSAWILPDCTVILFVAPWWGLPIARFCKGFFISLLSLFFFLFALSWPDWRYSYYAYFFPQSYFSIFSFCFLVLSSWLLFSLLHSIDERIRVEKFHCTRKTIHARSTVIHSVGWHLGHFFRFFRRRQLILWILSRLGGLPYDVYLALLFRDLMEFDPHSKARPQ